MQKNILIPVKLRDGSWVFPQARRFVFILFNEDRPKLVVDDVFRRVLWKKNVAALMCSSLDCKRVVCVI